MTLNEFIFSNAYPHKLLRHLSFWVSFGIEYYLQSAIPVRDAFFVALISFLCYFPACIICVYSFLHFLLPLVKARKYLRFALSIILFTIALLTLNYFTSILFYVGTCECPIETIKVLQIVGQDVINTLHAITTGGLILGFKVCKEWILKQKENQSLARLKVAKALRLAKARIYPRFLFRSLDSLKVSLETHSPDAPNNILRLSDLLSYILYESSSELISLEKELAMVENQLHFEKLNHDHRITISADVSDDCGNKMIKPFIMFSMLQSCFEVVNSENVPFTFALQVNAENETLFIRLTVAQLKPSTSGHSSVATLERMKARLAGLQISEVNVKIENSKLNAVTRVTLVSVDVPINHMIYEPS